MNVRDIDFNNMPTGEELLYEKANNPIVVWREEAQRAYHDLCTGSDELQLISIIVHCWYDYIRLTKGEQYYKAHFDLGKENLMEVYNIAVNGFCLTEE